MQSYYWADVCVIICIKCVWEVYINPCGSMYVTLWMYECVCLHTIYGGKSHCRISARARADILALPKNPQWSSPIQQPCPNKLYTSRLFFHFLSASLPHSHPSSCFSFDCHPLANPDHTIEPNHIWQFKLDLFSLCLALQNTSQQNGLRASAAPTLFCSHLSARTRVCMCVIISEC